MSSNKKQLGQYYTTQYEKILQDIHIPANVVFIVEPFAGNGDLVKYIDSHAPDPEDISIECYDIDPQNNDTQHRDTILDPPDYLEKFVITNPPYIARNKSDNKEPFDKYGENDLYKCFIRTILQEDNQPAGGIIIIPVNFFIGNRRADIRLRADFLNKYEIKRVNLFEERVFDDTSSAVCAVLFKERDSDNYDIQFNVYPGAQMIKLYIGPPSYIIADEIINLPHYPEYDIQRWTTNTSPDSAVSNLVLKCLDGTNPDLNNLDTVIHMDYIESPEKDKYKDTTSKLSARSFAVLVITPSLSVDIQLALVDKFNEYILEERKKYNSMFLSSYREFARKRISFNLAYKIIGHLLHSHI